MRVRSFSQVRNEAHKNRTIDRGRQRSLYEETSPTEEHQELYIDQKFENALEDAMDVGWYRFHAVIVSTCKPAMKVYPAYGTLLVVPSFDDCSIIHSGTEDSENQAQ